CAVEGGTLTLLNQEGLDVELCTSDGLADNLRVDLQGNAGSRLTYAVTDAEGTILQLTTEENFQFEGSGDGVILIYAVSHQAGLLGLAPGLRIDDLQGCHALSNPIRIVRLPAEDCGDEPCTVEGGTLIISGSDQGTEITLCTADGEDDTFGVFLANNDGDHVRYLVTDEDGTLLAITEDRTFNFEGAGAGANTIFALTYNSGLLGLEIGLALDDLQGCYALSNPVRVLRSPAEECGADVCTATIGTLRLSGGGTERTICAGDGRSDALTVVTDASGSGNLRYVLTDGAGRILDLSTTGTFDLDGAGAGTSLLYALRYAEGLLGLNVGGLLADLGGCYALSNPVTIIRESGEECAVTGCDLDGGALALTSGGDEVTVCVGDGEPDPFSVRSSGATGRYYAFLLTTVDGTIIGLFADPAFDFETGVVGTCLLYGLSFEGGLSGSLPGMQVDDLEGCYALSNPITINRLQSGVDCAAPLCTATGGELALLGGGTQTSLCVDDGVGEQIRVVVDGNAGSNFTYLLTDGAGNIRGISPSPIFNLENTGGGLAHIYGLSYASELTGLVTGGNLADLEGCYDLTNPVEIIRNTGEGCIPVCTVRGGNLSVRGGGDQIAFCVGDEMDDDFRVEIEFQVGRNFLYLQTNTAGVIEAIAANPNFTFANAEPGTSLIRGISFGEDLTGVSVGANLAGLSGCYALSNPVRVVRRPAIACEVE
ncbi:MAG: hypothetical protein AAFZ52_17530, partial [Bacteroidota bacterium]